MASANGPFPMSFCVVTIGALILALISQRVTKIAKTRVFTLTS